MPSAKPASIDATLELLKSGDYIADRSLATVLFLALKLGQNRALLQLQLGFAEVGFRIILEISTAP